MCIWNSAFKHTAWSTSLSPRAADDAGLVQFDFTRSVSRKNYHAHFRDRGGGDCDTCHQDNVVTWQRRLWLLSIQTLNCCLWAEYWCLWKKLWHHVIIGIKHACVCVVGVKLPRVFSPRGAITRVAPSWSPGAARQHPQEFDTNNTHTIMFDPLNNMWWNDQNIWFGIHVMLKGYFNVRWLILVFLRP